MISFAEFKKQFKEAIDRIEWRVACPPVVVPDNDPIGDLKKVLQKCYDPNYAILKPYLLVLIQEWIEDE